MEKSSDDLKSEDNVTLKLDCASFNVLADAYLSYGNYGHVDRDLLVSGARLSRLVELIADLPADIIGLQEAEKPLVEALEGTREWQSFWSPKQGDAPDGCLMLVRHGIVVTGFTTHPYTDGSGHIAQSIIIDDVVFANTHIKWSPAGDPNHSGIAETRELLEWFSGERHVVVFADCNDRPGGPVRALFERAGFTNVCGDEPTAFVEREPVALDIIATRGVQARYLRTAFQAENIPDVACPSDHIPVMATIDID